MAEKKKATGKKKAVLDRLDRVEGKLLNAQANLGGMIRDLQEIRETVDPPEEKKAEDPKEGDAAE